MVLDASALLATLFAEPGGERVRDSLSVASVSTVNWAEVGQRVRERGADVEEIRARLLEAGLDFVALTVEDAERAADLRAGTRAAGLSLADRCCLALAARTDQVALTADAAWAHVEVGVEVQLIR